MTDSNTAPSPAPVRKYRTRSRLSRLALTGKGVSVRECLQKAAVAVGEMREPCLAEIDRCLAALEADFGARAVGRGSRDLDEAYRLSGNIIDAAFAFPAWNLDVAGRALCDLVDGFEEAGATDWPAFDVHVQALRLLRTAGDSLTAADRASIIDGLKAVGRKHGVVDLN
ncbi:MAG: hypothetical protein JSR86_11215 [Proteobacteria bacterium]|nr:hypothetical protein [Pseudomonadota bacterium]